MSGAVRPKLGLARQAATCALFCIAALAVMAWRHPADLLAGARTGLPMQVQAALVVAATLAAWLAVRCALGWPAVRRRLQVQPALRQLDLSGRRPLLIALCAGIGEELLFRAALLPALGLPLSSALFALAHARTALLAPSRRARGLYMAQTLVAGLCLGLLFQHLGLLVAIGLHVLIDWAGLTLLHARNQDIDHGAQPA